MASNPSVYGKAVPVKLRKDAALHAVKCCLTQSQVRQSHSFTLLLTLCFPQSPIASSAYGCYDKKTFAEAEAVCAASKMRLCTQAEISSGRTSNTGCGYDRMRVWTATQSGACSPSSTVQPRNTTKPDSLCSDVCALNSITGQEAEILNSMVRMLVEAALVVREESPQCVPSIIGINVDLDGDHSQIVELLTPTSAIASLLRCIDALSFASPRVHANTLLYLSLSYSSSFTFTIDGGPGIEPIFKLDPNVVNPAPCSGQGVNVGGVCICGPSQTGTMCETRVANNQAYLDGWRKGFSVSLGNATAFIPPVNVLGQTTLNFDTTAKLFKSTTLAMVKADVLSEVNMPTSHLSPIELMRAVEDLSWLNQKRANTSAAFNTMLPKMLRDQATFKKAYQSLSSMLKFVAMKAAVIDCGTLMPLALSTKLVGSSILCGNVAQTLGDTYPDKIVDICNSNTKIVDGLEKAVVNSKSVPLKTALGDMLELIRVAKLHSQCPQQCNRKGVCLLQYCECLDGWSGDSCMVEAPLPPGACPRNCSSHGTCRSGTCLCEEGWITSDCSVSSRCLNDCWDHGDCVDGRCYCHTGYRGVDCSHSKDYCPDDFTCHHGSCVNQQCICDEGWIGDDCTLGNLIAGDGFLGDL